MKRFILFSALFLIGCANNIVNPNDPEIFSGTLQESNWDSTSGKFIVEIETLKNKITELHIKQIMDSMDIPSLSYPQPVWAQQAGAWGYRKVGSMMTVKMSFDFNKNNHVYIDINN